MKIFCIGLLVFINLAVNAQTENKDQSDTLSVEQLQAAIEKKPGDIKLHQQYIKGVGVKNPALKKQYNKWMKKFPHEATVPFAIGEAYWDKELPVAKPYLLKAVQIDPTLGQAYYDLYIDAERWGKFGEGQQYLLKATLAQPDSGEYAVSYAYSFHDSDPGKFRELSLEVANRFHDSDRGAGALSLLAMKTNNTQDKIKYYELLREKFSPDKFQLSYYGMEMYFYILLNESPERAVSLAQSLSGMKLQDEKKWPELLALAKNMVKANDLLAQNKAEEALVIAESIKLPWWSAAKNAGLLLKVRALDAAGKTLQAYDLIKAVYAGMPEEEIYAALDRYGKKLKKDQQHLEKDVWYVRDTAAREATPFTLKQYLAPGNLSLSDLKGKVVLLTYWFPGCGPCRGEFPHFQHVIDKFKGQNVVYIGINVLPEQNEYVIPFMRSSGYSFLPLEDVEGRKKGNLDNRDAAPVNFLIDQQGRVVFKKFNIDGGNEQMLEVMITSLLNRKIS